MSFSPLKRKLSVLAVSIALGTVPVLATAHDKVFNRVASFPVFLNSNIANDTVAEIVDVSADGNTLVYTDGVFGKLGFVNIADPANPMPAGIIEVNGEPTSVAVAGNYALAAVNTSADYINTSGKLLVVDIASQTIVANHDLGGQPDAVAISPDGQYAAVIIENERNEDLGAGEPPQAPAGYLVIVHLNAPDPADWSLQQVDLTGLADVFPGDPEPEYVDINSDNMAVLTFQENNYLALVDLATASVVNHFSAGTVDLTQIDVSKDSLIDLSGSLNDIPREPDGVAWLTNTRFVTADEGDLYGGSRGFTIFDTDGTVRYSAGNTVEHAVVKVGHYPDKRSGKKGNESENVDVAIFGEDKYLFVASERSSVVLVYKVKKDGVKFQQILPAGVGPEGVKAIPSRNLLVAASEEDSRADAMRSVLNIYRYEKADMAYPTIQSENRLDGTPIPWGALSGLAVDREDNDTVYTIHDSFYNKSRIFVMNVDEKPAQIKSEIVLNDGINGPLAQIDAAMVNADGSVNLDMEGISVREDGGFWIASEGAGTIGDASRPFETYDLLLKVGRSGDIQQVVQLPATTNAKQVRFGYEGVASVGSGDEEVVYVAFQREWAGDPKGSVRIGRYATASGEWTFYYYPLDAKESPNGGWVGLSDLAALGNGEFAVLERDNQAGPDARIKRIYKVSVDGLAPAAEGGVFPALSKTLIHDLMGDLQAPGGLVPEKIEGLAVDHKGNAWVVNDNDGVDDNNGETQLLKLKKLFQ